MQECTDADGKCMRGSVMVGVGERPSDDCLGSVGGRHTPNSAPELRELHGGNIERIEGSGYVQRWL